MMTTKLEEKLSDSNRKVDAFIRLVNLATMLRDTRIYATLDDYSWSKCPMSTEEIHKLSLILKHSEELLKNAQKEQDQIKQGGA